MVNTMSPAVQKIGLGGPLPAGWQECTLTRAKEIEALCHWSRAVATPERNKNTIAFAQAIFEHLNAAREAARVARWRFHSQSRRERAMSNIDAAEVALLNIAPTDYILGQLTSLQEHVRCHLVASDPRRAEFERIVTDLSENAKKCPEEQLSRADESKAVEAVRGKIAAITRAASSAALREQVRVRSFCLVVVTAAVVMFVLASLVALIGWKWPTWIPLCFEPEMAGRSMVVCPTQESMTWSSVVPPNTADLDGLIATTVTRYDILIVELIGMIAAALAAANAIRKMRGSSERYRLPVALAALKLPTGAVTAFLGLLLMRGQFVPGLSALDSPAQILAWALVFGYAQQLFTRFVDRKGQAVLASVRGADLPRSTPDPPTPVIADSAD